MAKIVAWRMLNSQLLVGQSGADTMTTVKDFHIQRRGRAKVGPDIETSRGVTTCHRHHLLHQNTSPKPVGQREAIGVAKENQGPQPPGIGRVTGNLEADPDPDPDLGPGTEVNEAEETIVAVNTLRLGAAQDQEIGQNIMEMANQCLVKLNIPTDECQS